MNKKKFKREQENTNIRNIRHYSEEQFDRLIVYLNSGALVLTIGFVKDIIDIHSSENMILLKTSWILFTLSLILILSSHKTTKIATNYHLDKMKAKSEVYNVITEWLNIFSFITFISGIVTFLIFLFINFKS